MAILLAKRYRSHLEGLLVRGEPRLAFDAFVPEAAATALESAGPSHDRDLRRLLSSVMSEAGFVVHPQEWWHWEYGTRSWAAVTRAPVRYGRTAPDDGANSE